MNKVKVFIFGITGSIGENFLNVYKKNLQYIDIAGSTFHNNHKKILNIKKKYNIGTVFSTKNNNTSEIQNFLNKNKIDIVINGIKGFDGLLYSIITIKSNINLALANKETLVAAGKYIYKLLKKHRVKLIPIDSEHSSLKQLIDSIGIRNISKLFLTASGGMFSNYTLNDLKKINDDDAFLHPNWEMGKEITVNSSTLVNKIFEVIEAKYIFNFNIKNIEIIIHKQSIIHGMIKTYNNDYFMNASFPTMELPIYNSLFGRKIVNNNYSIKELFTSNTTLSFEKPGVIFNNAIKLLNLSQEKKYGELALLIINEFVVQKFMQRQIKFYQIVPHILQLMTKLFLQYTEKSSLNSLESILNFKNYLLNFCKINYTNYNE